MNTANTWRRRLGVLLLSVLTALMGLLGTAAVQAPVAAADVSCYGDYCSGMDPKATGCERGAKTVAWKDTTGARLELRWSPTCKTNWARYQQYPRGWYFGNVPLELRAIQDTGYTQRLSFGVNGAGEGTYWTPMIYSPERLVYGSMVYQCHSPGDCLVAAGLTGEAELKTDPK